MPHVLLVNPSPRKGTTRKSASKGKAKMATRKKARTAAQKRATAKMIAANRLRSRAAKRPARKAAASAAKRTTRRPARKAVASRPTRRRRGSHPITPARVASDAGRKLRYRRPNPIGGFIKDALLPAAVGGAGAIALDVAVAALPLPAMMKAGPMAPLVRVAGAVGLGMLGSQVFGRRYGEQITAGALTVTLYNVARAGLAKISSGRIPGLSMYPDGYLGAYVSGGELGYTDSGVQIGGLPDNAYSDLEGYETGVYR